MSDILSELGEAVSGGVDAAKEAVSKGVDTAGKAVSKGVKTVKGAVSEGMETVKGAVSEGMETVKGAVSEGMETVKGAVSEGMETVKDAVSDGIEKINNSYESASEASLDIVEKIVSAPDTWIDAVADSEVGQYWSDFWDLEVESIDAIGGWLEDTAEELAEEEDVPQFIRDFMNGYIGANVPTTYFGISGAKMKGVGNSLAGLWKGYSTLLGHPCKTEENIADAAIMAGNAAGKFVTHPIRTSDKAFHMVNNWWKRKIW